MQNDKGKLFDDAHIALLDKVVDQQWTTTGGEDQLLTMNFTLEDTCSNNWEIATVSFRTQRVKQIQLIVGNTVINTWVRKH